MTFAKPITVLPFVFWGLADACDTFTISGRVADQGSGAQTWIGVFQDSLADQAEAVESTWVDAGEFRLEVPCAESVTLLAMRKGAVPVVRRISGTVPTVVDLRFAPGFSLIGSVYSDEHLPIAEARVSITRIDDVEVRLPESLTTWRSSKSGTFAAEGLEPGTYRVAASADGHIPVELPEVVVVEDGVNRVDMELPRAFFVAGRVVEVSGLAVAGAEVRANYLGSTRKAGVARIETTAASDSEGAFRVGPFRKGQEVLISARADLSRSDAAHYMAPMDDLVLTLHHAVEIRGTVSNAFTGELVSDFALEAYGSGESRSFAFRDAAGEFLAAVFWHTHAIEISAPGFVSWHTRVDFGSGGGEHLIGDVALEPERIVTGRVVDAASGLPIQGAWVVRWFGESDPRHRFSRASLLSLSAPANRLAPVARTDEDGHFRLSGLPRDEVDLRAAKMMVYTPEVVGLPAGTEYVDIELTAAVNATIEGMLVTDEGTPAEGWVYIREKDGGGNPPQLPLTGLAVNQGKFEFEVAVKANEKYLVWGDSAMGLVEPRLVMIRSNESGTGIRLVVRRLGRVSGLLAGLGTAQGAVLSVLDGSGRTVRSSWLSQDGPYALQGVPEGRFTLRAKTRSGRAIVREFESDGHGETHVDLTFTGASRLTGVVTAGRRPIPKVEVWALPRDKSLASGKSSTMSNGAYAMDGLDDGEYAIRVRGQWFRVEVSGDTVYDVRLGPLAISGVVRSEGSVVGALVRATPTAAEGGSGGKDRVDSRGSFRIDGLHEGEYIVHVSHPGHQTVSRTVLLGSAIDDLDVHLSPTDGQEAEPSQKPWEDPDYVPPWW